MGHSHLSNPATIARFASRKVYPPRRIARDLTWAPEAQSHAIMVLATMIVAVQPSLRGTVYKQVGRQTTRKAVRRT